MVVFAQGDEVPHVGRTAVGPVHDVVNLEMMGRIATRDTAAVVTVDRRPARVRRCFTRATRLRQPHTAS